MSAVQDLLAAAAEWERAASEAPAPPLTRDEQEADVLLSDAPTAGESAAAGRRGWWPLHVAGGALLLACFLGLLATATGAAAAAEPLGARRTTSPAPLRRLDKSDWLVDSRNPSLRRAAMQEEGSIADDITAVFSVQGGPLFDEGDADGSGEGSGEAQVDAPLRREEQGGEETRDQRSFERAFREAGSAEEGEEGQTLLEQLIRDLPGGRRLRGALS